MVGEHFCEKVVNLYCLELLHDELNPDPHQPLVQPEVHERHYLRDASCNLISSARDLHVRTHAIK